MKKIGIALLLGGLLAALSVSAGASVVRMSWQMGPEAFAFRNAHVAAYPVAASDFEIPVRCAYLGDLDAYVWQMRAEIPAVYQAGEWVLYGQGAGMAVAFSFTIKDGAVGTLAPIPFPKPATSDGNALASVGFDPPRLALAGISWEILVDGAPIENRSIDPTPPTRSRTYVLRGKLPGSPRAHYLLSDSVEVLPDPGSKT